MGKGKAKGSDASKKTKEKRAAKVVEDKTFGLKNKNKSKKVQQYIAQVSQGARGGAKGQPSEAEMAKRRREKEMQKQAEKEMLALLGDAYALDKKKKKKVVNKKEMEKEKEKAEEEQEKQKEQDAKDFGTPICPLRDVFGQGSKAVVERVCVDLVWKDNLVGKAADGSQCLYIKVNDGTTLNPMTMCLMGETPTTFEYKINTILDVRGAVAMVRGDKVLLELPKGTQGLSKPEAGVECSMTSCSDRLTEFVREKIAEEEEIRERGGIPIEERIEEERANLKGPLTPVTKERFFEWKEKKRKAKEEAEEKKRKEVARRGVKGLSMLSGRALFDYDKSLFVDDDGAMRSNETAQREPEEADAADDSAKAAAPPEGEEAAEEEEEGGDSAQAAPSAAGGDSATEADLAAVAIQEKLYLEGDDDLDDLDDLDDDDDDDEEEE